MWTRCWKRLAGCIAISCALAAGAEYQAGAARRGDARVVVIEDRRGTHVIVAQAEFPITRAVADYVAAQLVKTYGLERADIVLAGAGERAPRPEDIVEAVAAVVVAPAVVKWDGRRISIAGEGGCIATLWPVGEACGDGATVRSPIRAAFQMIKLPHGLQQRGEMAAAYPIQAIAFGKQVTVLAAPGETKYEGRDVLVIPHANDAGTPGDFGAAIGGILRRVGR